MTYSVSSGKLTKLCSTSNQTIHCVHSQTDVPYSQTPCQATGQRRNFLYYHEDFVKSFLNYPLFSKFFPSQLAKVSPRLIGHMFQITQVSVVCYKVGLVAQIHQKQSLKTYKKIFISFRNNKNLLLVRCNRLFCLKCFDSTTSWKYSNETIKYCKSFNVQFPVSQQKNKKLTLWRPLLLSGYSYKVGTCESFFRSNRISNRIGHPIRFRIKS